MELHGRLAPLDFVVIAAYIVLVIGIGMWISFRRKGAEDLFLGGRRFRWPSVGLSIFGTNIGPSFLIAACGAAYSTGMVTANFEWLAWWFLLLLGMLFAPYYLGTRISTMPQFIRRRFGSKAHAFLSWYALFTTIVLWLGGTLYAGGVLLGQIMDWPLWLSVFALALIATSFTMAGGLAAVVATDVFQSVLMILGSAGLTLIALAHAGGLEAFLEKVPRDYWNLVKPADDPDYPWPAMFLGYPVLGIWFWCTDQTIVQRVLGARDLRQGQYGTVFAGFLKILPPFLFMLPGMLCYAMHPDLSNPDEAFMTMVSTYLPAGMVGLIVAVLVAALISTLDSGLNSFSTVFTLDVYVKRLRPGASAGETRWIGRFTTLAAAGIAFACAVSMEGAGRKMFDLLQGIIAFIAPPVAAVFLIGVLWRRATAAAALTTLIAGSLLSVSVGVCHFMQWPGETFWPHYLLLSFYLFAGIAVFMIGLSLLTRKAPEEEDLPALKKIQEGRPSRPGAVWALWGVLALFMLALYLLFN